MPDFVIDHRPDGTPVFVDREEHYFMHHGIPGQKWGKRNGPPYPLGSDDRSHPEFSLKENEKVFISGTSKLFNDDVYGRKSLPDQIKSYLDYAMRKNARILVGDCWGVDEAVQNYLAENSYENVSIYVSGDEVRNNADNGSLNWKIHHIDSSKYEEGSVEWHAEKDKAMNREATSGLAIILEEGSSATRKNIDRFIDENKNVNIFQLSKKGSEKDSWVYEEDYMEHSEHSNLILIHGEDGKTFFVEKEKYFAHHGIPGQKWGKRNGPPYPLDKKDYSREEKKMAKGLKQLYSGKKTDLYGTASYNTYGRQGDKLNRSITNEVQKYRDEFNIIAEPYYDYVNYFHNLDDAEHWTKIIKNEGYDPKEYEKEFINARNKRNEATLKAVEHIVDEVGDLTLKKYKMSGIDKRYLVTGVLRNMGTYPWYDRLPTETTEENHSDQKRLWNSLTKRYGE